MSLEDYEIVVLKEEDLDEVAHLLESEYLPREPIARGLHMTSVEPTRGRAGEDIRICLRSGLSTGAKHRATGKLVGFRLSKLGSDEATGDFEEVEVQEKAYRLLGQVFENSDFSDGATKVLSMFMVCVHRDHARRGLGRKMVEACMEIGVSQGCTQAITIVTGKFSKSIFIKLGYTERFVFDLKTAGPEYNFDFSVMDGNSTMVVLTKAL